MNVECGDKKRSTDGVLDLSKNVSIYILLDGADGRFSKYNTKEAKIYLNRITVE